MREVEREREKERKREREGSFGEGRRCIVTGPLPITCVCCASNCLVKRGFIDVGRFPAGKQAGLSFSPCCVSPILTHISYVVRNTT